eukprot:TRINITY_DN75006_c0_g1_i1.p1 TRINITY_DN75006_c0_g1~~TRINITY_DN75006_c0_g1_i1.p1  ORF type:complete len:210 (-),score=33.97 TRINITY_DN75006_c0_g1_i1:257-859(-)
MMDTATLLASTSVVRALGMCCSLGCCKSCECCNMMCCKIKCCKTLQGSWHHSACLQRQLDEILDEIEEKQMQVTTKMPGLKIGQFTEYRTLTNKKVRCLSVTYLEQRTLKVRKFSIVLHPSESVKGASKLCSEISMLGKSQASMPGVVEGAHAAPMTLSSSGQQPKLLQRVQYRKTLVCTFCCIVGLLVLIWFIQGRIRF